jgi:hypothetical protein
MTSRVVRLLRRGRASEIPAGRPFIAGADQKLDRIEFQHLPDEFRPVVRGWFEGRVGALALDGSRSVQLPHPAGGRRVLKVKGAGLSGGPVAFGTRHRSGPIQPIFDYEGRLMEDVAGGHDGAFRGGASFQQAANEFRVTARLSELGYEVIPCVGYGRIAKGGQSSWFSVFDHEPGLDGETIYPRLPLADWVRLNREIGTLLFTLAAEHDLIGYCWYAATPDGRFLVRDVHPFRFADPFNMSQISWVMQVAYAFHIRSNSCRLRAVKWNDPRLPPDLHVWQYRAFFPEVTEADHDAFRQDLVIPYMRGAPADFSVDRLVAALRANRITAALMAACPPRFARF